MNAQGTDRLRSIYAEFEALDSLSILCREFKSDIQVMRIFTLIRRSRILICSAGI